MSSKRCKDCKWYKTCSIKWLDGLEHLIGHDCKHYEYKACWQNFWGLI